MTMTLPVSSFVAEAYGRPPEVEEIACVSLTETAADKLVALTRRTAMELAGLSRDPDPTLIRHVYDLHLMLGHLDPATVAILARDVAAADAGETRKALEALGNDAAHRRRYEAFLDAMVYGEKPEFREAIRTVAELAGLT